MMIRTCKGCGVKAEFIQVQKARIKELEDACKEKDERIMSLQGALKSMT